VTNIIPRVNDEAESLKKMASWIYQELGKDTPWHISES